MAATPPEEPPITGVLVVADPKKCPPGYDLLYQTEDKKEDCDLWKDSFFKSRVTRYLCYTRSSPLNNSNETMVLADIVIQNEKETPPAGYALIEHTVDTSEKATRKKQICVRMLPRSSTNQAINKLIFSKSKRPPVQYTSAGEINNLMLYYKFGPVPQPDTTNTTDKPAVNKPTPAPRSRINNSLRTSQPSSGLGMVNKQLNNNLYTHPLAGVPFQVNSKYVLSSGSAKPLASDISYRSYADINSEYSYSFTLERSTLNKGL